ncbi:hypothetical protein SERLA73DRAFT_137073 [Serpula lacrymans var. lacrymans S7.3]|uniref:ARID domain-containing protein n=1 Tax=Serpula lacrymans var. lacrymans (strain S7.3) TaxID=936435 RepID=F8PYM2_SERL3|nr:hypothetical protein SERLA73DRAFT_137073 [Serpula lacrymans var. lacrymans S7.3]
MQQVQFEVTRRKGLMVKLNHAITHISAQPRPHDGLLVSSLILPPPLDKARFEIHYANFCRTKGLEMTSRVALSDAQWVDLYQLHVNVMKEGTFAKVNQNNLWHIVGGRLGYVRASDNTVDPPRCDPELAAQLSRIYKEHLEHFDFLYISSVVDMAKRKAEIQKQS